MKIESVTYAPKQRATLPVSWKKAAGILSKSAKKNVAELKKTRRKWDARMKVFEKRPRT